MGKKSSIYFGKEMVKHTADLAADDSVSGRINRTIERYAAICEHHGVEITVEEKQHILDVLGDGFYSPLVIGNLADEIRDTTSGSVDVVGLADKLEKKEIADLIALVESIGK